MQFHLERGGLTEGSIREIQIDTKTRRDSRNVNETSWMSS